MARESDIYGVTTRVVSIPPGATNAVLITQHAGEVASMVKYLSGGSLEILMAPPGTTWAGASLVPLNGQGYLMGTSEVVSFDGAVRYYLMATGATTTYTHLRGLSSGF